MITLDITADSNHATVDYLYGFSIRENAGTAAAATVNLREGAVGGQIIFVLELAADESATLVLDKAIPTEDGVYVEVVSGSVEGVLFY